MSTFLSDSISERSPFPDGQPHLVDKNRELSDWSVVTCRLASADDLLRLAMLVSIRRRRNRPVHTLRVLYLMGGRMDRPLSEDEPYTLKVVCDFINSLEIPKVSVFCPHSAATNDLLTHGDTDNTYFGPVEAAFYDSAAIKFLRSVTEEFDGGNREDVRQTDQLSFVFPDLGAKKRFSKSPLLRWWPNANLVVLHKDREERTGKILGTRIICGYPSKYCLIVDDLCDGGATFIASADVLKHGHPNERLAQEVLGSAEENWIGDTAKKVGLAVCHGIFSKGLPLEGIDFIATTNSFKEHEPQAGLWVQKFV